MKKLFAIVLAVLMIAAFAAPAMAKVKVGGITFVDFYWNEMDGDARNGGRQVGANNSTNDWSQTELEVPVITRLNATWTNEDNVGMFIELGIGGANGTEGAVMRHAYGWWKITPSFELRVGHTTTIIGQVGPSQLLGTHCAAGTIVGIGYGNWDNDRQPQVRFTYWFPNDFGRISFAIVDPGHRFATPAPTADNTLVPATADGSTEETEIPRFDLAIPIHLLGGALKLYPSFMWQQKDIDQVLPGADDDVTTWAAIFGMTWGMGPFTFSGEIWASENPTNSDAATNRRTAWVAQVFDRDPTDGVAVNDGISDYEVWGWFVDLAFKVGPATIHGIVGNQEGECDRGPAQNDDLEYETWMYGISVPIQLAKGFSIRPEIMFYEYGDDNLHGDNALGPGGSQLSYDDGDGAVVGVQFQVTF